MSIPIFDIVKFRSQYPMYFSISDATLEGLWIEVDTVGTPIISTLVIDKQEHYYYVVEAHLAELFQRGTGINGIINSATQGTVTATATVDNSNSLIWWNQTTWGAKIAQLIKMRGGFTFICGGNNYYDRYS